VKDIIVRETELSGYNLRALVNVTVRHEPVVGEPAQLPPVTDKPLYHSKPSSTLQEQGNLAYFMFNTVVKLTLNQRVKAPTHNKLHLEID